MQNIKEYLSYNPNTGVFIWIKPICKYPINMTAGNKRADGRITIRFNNKRYYAHRLAWYFSYGEFPNRSIDHINQDPSDNRLCNLREAVDADNIQNISKARIDNKSGYRGVCWDKSKNKWMSKITSDNKQIFLGYFDTKEKAHDAYLAAKRKHHTFWVENK
jgi:hypothetical protein